MEVGRTVGAACPLLETSRLRLQAHTQADFADMVEMWGDPEVVRHIGGKPSTAGETWNRLLRYGGLWPVLGYGYWCVRDKRSGRYVGDVGCADFHRDAEPSISGTPEAGWALAKWAQGRGFANEAVAAALAWLDRGADYPRTVCLIAQENAPSIRIAIKNGFTAQGSVRVGDKSVPLWVRDRSSK